MAVPRGAKVIPNDTKTYMPNGVYNFMAQMSAGSATLQYSFDDGTTYVDIQGMALTATETDLVTLPECHIKVQLTGDAVFTLNPADRYY